MVREKMRWAVLAWAAMGAAGCSNHRSEPRPIDSAAAVQAADGARLFQRRCAVCHGATGEGQEMAFGARSANLSDAALQARLTDEALVKVMQNGAGRMPAVTGLQADEAKAIADHVRSLRKP